VLSSPLPSRRLELWVVRSNPLFSCQGTYIYIAHKYSTPKISSSRFKMKEHCQCNNMLGMGICKANVAFSIWCNNFFSASELTAAWHEMQKNVFVEGRIESQVIVSWKLQNFRTVLLFGGIRGNFAESRILAASFVFGNARNHVCFINKCMQCFHREMFIFMSSLHKLKDHWTISSSENQISHWLYIPISA
jgi:hypothetical protein